MRFPKSNTEAAVLALVCLGVSGCRLDMHDAPRYDALEASRLFENGASARPLVEGTIARDELYEGDATEPYGSGFGPAGFWEELPPAFLDEMKEDGVTMADLLERGRERFNIYCSPCHGYTGQGNGMIVRRGFRAPPTFHNTRNREEGLGRIYFIITMGYGQMYSYGHAVKPADRWAIASYIRALQLSQYAPLSVVPEGLRARLEEEKK